MKKVFWIVILCFYFSLNTLANNKCNALAIDYFGDIWYANSEGLFSINNQQKPRLINEHFKNVSALALNGDYVILGTTEGKLAILHNLSEKIIYQFDLADGISSIATMNRKTYISTLGNGMYCFEKNKLVSSENLKQKFIYDMAIYNNTLVLGTDEGLIVADSLMNLNNSIYKNLPDILCTSICNNNDLFYVGTQNGRLFTFKNNSIEVLPNKFEAEIRNLYYSNNKVYYSVGNNLFEWNVLNNQHKIIDTIEQINAIFHTHTGNLNVGAAVGIVTIKSEVYTVVPTKNTPSIITTSSNGTIYYAHNNYLMKLKNSIATSKEIAKLPSNISCLHLHNEQLWIGTTNSGLYLLDTSTQKIKPISFITSLPKTGVLDIVTNDTSIWVSSLAGVWWSNIKKLNFQQNEHLKRQKIFYVYDMLFDTKNRLWFGTDGQGLFFLQNNILQPVKDKKLKATTVYNILEDKQKQIWFNSSKFGLYCLMPNDSIINLNSSNGLYNDEVLSLGISSHNLLVASCKNMIQFIDTKLFYTSCINISNAEISLNSIAIDKEDIWLGSNKGLIHMQLPDYLYNNERIIAIYKTEMNNKTIDINQHTFNADENSFKIFYKVSLPLNDVVYYRYMLQGQENQWINTTDNIINLINLRSGIYKLRIQASNNTDFNNAVETSYSFTILKPMYFRWWFITSISVFSFFLIRFVIKRRDTRKSKIQILEKEHAIAQYEALKTQVNPHFLFNSLNALIYLIDDDKEKAMHYTQKLSNFYRKLISFNNKELISLKDEMDVNENYMYLQTIRFGSLITFKNSLSGNQMETWQVPPLTIQMLCENAIKHNTIDIKHPIQIHIFIKDNYLVVQNNISKKISSSKGEGIGIKNINQQFLLHTNKNIIITESLDLFTVKMPKI